MIETPRLIIKPFKESDFSLFSSVICCPKTMEYYTEAISSERALRWFNKILTSYHDLGFSLWAVYLKDTMEYLGDCGITMQKIDGQILPEIGYHFHYSKHNKGYATEAAIAIKKYGFEVLGFKELYSYMTINHIASQKVAIKNGMKLVKEYIEEDIKHVVYKIDKEEYFQSITVNLGLGVGLFKSNDLLYNLKEIKRITKEASKQNIDLICFGEAILQGFHSLNGDYNRDIKIALEQNSPEIDSIRLLAKENAVAIALGYLEKESENIYSSYIVIGRNGNTLLNYRRRSPGWKEPFFTDRYKEELTLNTFTLKGITFGVGLCGDFWYDRIGLPEFSCKHVIWPVYLDDDYIAWTTGADLDEYATQAKIIAPNVYLVNSLLNDEYKSIGKAVIFKDGMVYKELKANLAGILSETIKEE